ncbi:Na+ dependent nucleoside transporter N-terminal domain-containing protein [Staphylococcus aureus]
MRFYLAQTGKNCWKYVGILLAIQLIFAFILLKTTMGIKVIGAFCKWF